MQNSSIFQKKIKNQIQSKVPQSIVDKSINQKSQLIFLQNQKILFIENIDQIRLCLNYLIQRDYACFSIIPILSNGQIFKIQTKQRKIQINRNIIAFNKFCNTWTFKLNPKNGNLHLAYQYYKFSSDTLNINLIIQSYFQSGFVKEQFKKIISETSNNEFFTQDTPKILKYAANSNKYAWGIKKYQQKIQSLKWQAQSQQSNSQDSQDDTQQFKQSYIQNLQEDTKKNQNCKLPLYEKTKKSYNQLPILLKQSKWLNNQSNIDSRKQFIITQQEDLSLYQQNLALFHNRIINKINKKQNINCENQNSTTDIDSTIQSHLKEDEQQQYKGNKLIQQFNILNQQALNVLNQQSFNKQKQSKIQEVNLKHYLIANSCTLSKKTIWHIIMKLLSECVKSMYLDSQILFKQNKPFKFTIHQGLQVQLNSFYESFMFLNCQGESSSIDSQNIQQDQIQIQKKISVKVLPIIFELIIGKTDIVQHKYTQITKHIRILNQINQNSENQTSFFQNWKYIVQLTINQYYNFKQLLDMPEYILYAVFMSIKSQETIPYVDWIVLIANTLFFMYSNPFQKIEKVMLFR